MKRLAILVASMVLVFALAGCASQASSSSEAVESESSAALQTVETADEAAAGAGFDGFTVPDGDIGLQNGPIGVMQYSYGEGIAEAYGGVGAAELAIYKCAQGSDAEIPASDIEYKYEWTEDANGIEVTCFGNIEGQIMQANWSADGFDYVMMVRGQGDMYDVFGLYWEDVAMLVDAIK